MSGCVVGFWVVGGCGVWWFVGLGEMVCSVWLVCMCLVGWCGGCVDLFCVWLECGVVEGWIFVG